MTVLKSSSGVRGGSGGSATITELGSDPISPTTNQAWVLRTGSGGTGGGILQATMGLGFPYLSVSSGGSYTYQLSYYTEAGTIVRSTLS